MHLEMPGEPLQGRTVFDGQVTVDDHACGERFQAGAVSDGQRLAHPERPLHLAEVRLFDPGWPYMEQYHGPRHELLEVAGARLIIR